MVITSPKIIYWTLYAMQFNVWVVQSLQMDGRIWGDFFLLPDHMQFFNPVLVASLAPVFVTIYRLLGKCTRVTWVW